MWLGLARRRQLILPSWKGWLILLGLVSLVGYTVLGSLYPFLAKDTRLPQADLVIVEGWVSDHVIEAAKKELDEGRCRQICAAGVDLDKGNMLLPWRDWATVAAETLKGIGVPEEKIIVAPGGPIQRHRTYKGFEAALAKLKELNQPMLKINVVSEGPHARRSRLVAKKVFGKNAEIGMIVVDPLSFEPTRWWKASSGVKAIIMELIASTFEQFADSGR